MEDIQYPVSPGLEVGGSGRKKGACGKLYGRSREGWYGNDLGTAGRSAPLVQRLTPFSLGPDREGLMPSMCSQGEKFS